MGSENSKQFRDNSLLSFDENSIDYDGIITTEESSIDEENNDELCICNWKFLQLGTIFFNGKKTKWKSFLNT